MVLPQYFSTFYQSTFLSVLPSFAVRFPSLSFTCRSLVCTTISLLIVTLGLGSSCYSWAMQPFLSACTVLYLSQLCVSFFVMLVILSCWFKCPQSHSKATKNCILFLSWKLHLTWVEYRWFHSIQTCSLGFIRAEFAGPAGFYSILFEGKIFKEIINYFFLNCVLDCHTLWDLINICAKIM